MTTFALNNNNNNNNSNSNNNKTNNNNNNNDYNITHFFQIVWGVDKTLHYISLSEDVTCCQRDIY